MTSDRPRTRSPISKALAVCLAVADSTEPLRLSDLAQRTGMLPPTALRTVAELVDAGWVARDSSDRYLLGPALLKLARSPLHATSLAAMSRVALRWLADRLGLMANLQVLENFDVRIVAEVRSVRYERLVDREGERWPGHRTVAGVVLLSQLVEPERRRYLTTLAAAESAEASAELAEVLSVVRADRVYSNDTFDPLLAAIACPIVTPDEACHGALSIVGVRAEMADPDLRDRSVDLLRAACSALATAIAEPGTSVAALLS
ncbi:IclR family transcriptional regulator [Fodinicola acaciae]|uniref:IclR family transcriptional regulator n=1 Tax=Fodinicola acaciae TaxID=2681555 RepID=UPI0013D7434C|nr:helix-turn-helix domain-containing protein [Fodinicola acaciae]